MAKAMLKGIRRTQEQITADFTADMKEANKETKARSKFKKDVEHLNPEFTLKALEQRAEFFDFIVTENLKAHTEGRRLSDFFQAMRTKLIGGIELSENMVNALRKCMERDQPSQKGKKDAKPAKTVTLTLKIKKFLQTQLALDSRVITGVVKGESARAYLMEGHADMLNTMSWCLRCGRELTLPASYTIGFGETCAGHMGIPYPGELNSLSGKARNAYRKEILGFLHNQKFERWIPKSQIEEILERKEG